MSANSSLTTHDLSPEAIFGQVILPRRGRYVVLVLEVVIAVAVIVAVVSAVRAVFCQRNLQAAAGVAAERREEKRQLEAKLQARLNDQRRASQMAAWIRRDLPMQPLAIAVLDAIPAGVTLTRLDAEMAEGGAPQMTLRLSLRGEPEAAERAVSAVARALFKYGLRVVDQPVPQRVGQGVDASFAVQFPALDEWEAKS